MINDEWWNDELKQANSSLNHLSFIIILKPCIDAEHNRPWLWERQEIGAQCSVVAVKHIDLGVVPGVIGQRP